MERSDAIYTTQATTEPKYVKEARAAIAKAGPWLCKQRADGKWVIDQFFNGKIRRYGEYEKEDEAREVLRELREDEK